LSKNEEQTNPEPHTLQQDFKYCQGAFRIARESNRGLSREVSLYSSPDSLVKQRVTRRKLFLSLISCREHRDQCRCLRYLMMTQRIPYSVFQNAQLLHLTVTCTPMLCGI